MKDCNPIVIVTKSSVNLELAKRCIASCLKQSIWTQCHVYDNSETGLGESLWLDDYPSNEVVNHSAGVDLLVSAAWNFMLHAMFEEWHAEHVLVVNDDTILPSDFTSALMAHSTPFVTGYESQDLAMVELFRHRLDPLYPLSVVPNPDLSTFLIRRGAWEAIGEFDESMAIWCSDQDYHIRAHRLGLPLLKSTIVPYYHERSSTLRRSGGDDLRRLRERGDLDRASFRAKYDVESSSPEYASLFLP